MGYGGNASCWVSKQNEALIESGHRQLEHQYLERIKTLEKENSGLKKKKFRVKKRNC